MSSIAISKNATAWAYVLGACLLGLTFYLVAVVLERVATPGGVGRAGAMGHDARSQHGGVDGAASPGGKGST